MQRITMARVVVVQDRLSDLPDAILTHILSLLPCNKQVVRSSVLSTRWRFLWMSVPLSLHFQFKKKSMPSFIANVHRQLFLLRASHNIRSFKLSFLTYKKFYRKHFDVWLHFATKVANVEDFTLEIDYNYGQQWYELPQFAYKSSSLKNLALKGCQLYPSDNVNWTSLLSLSIRDICFIDGVIEKVLSGCPNLEHLELYYVKGIHCLEISSAKLKELIITDFSYFGLEILAPYIQDLQLLGFSLGIYFPRSVPSLVNAVINISFSFLDDDNMEQECSYLKELLHCLAHVHNLELGPWCIECMSVLELQGWQFPPSSWKFLKLNTTLEQLDLPGIWSFLQCSSDLETLVIHRCYYKQIDLLSRYTNEDEPAKRFETHNFNYSFVYLKTIKFINFHELLLNGDEFIRSLVKYFFKNATVLEKFIIVADAKVRGRDVSQDYGKLEQEFVSYPKSSPHASVVFSYQ